MILTQPNQLRMPTPKRAWSPVLGLALLLGFFNLSHTIRAQTVLINPATDGGFELGTGSLADNGWVQVSQPSNDTWFTGSGKTSGSYSLPSTSRCAYISADGGTTWAFNTAIAPNSAHIYKTVTVPAGETRISLSFRYQLLGTNNTRLLVYIAPDNALPNTNEPSPGGLGVSNNGWGAGTGIPYCIFAAATPTSGTAAQTFTAELPTAFIGNCNTARTFRIVFTSSRNSSGSSNNPPPAVDSISLVSSTPISAAPATFTINNTQPTGGTNFANFTDAINWVNAAAACGLPNSVTFNVSAGQSFLENTPYITVPGSSTRQVIFQRSGVGANPVLRPNGNNMGYAPIPNGVTIGHHDYGFCLFGADYVTFDGIDVQSNNVSSTIAVEHGYIVKNSSSINGANNNTIKNCAITLDRTSFQFATTTIATRGITQSANTAAANGYSASNSSGTNNNNGYYNITIGNVHQGIVLHGASSIIPDQNNKIGTLIPGTFNTIGRPGVANDIGNASTATAGINLQNQFNASVTNCNIQNITSTGNSVDGIAIGSLSGSFNGSGGFSNVVANNIVSFLRSTSTTSTSTLTGIRIQHDNTGSLGPIGFRVYNNVVSNITSAYTGASTATRSIRALFLPVGAPTNPTTVQYEIINNTLVIDGSSSPNLSNIVFEHAFAGSVLRLRNNLFFNNTVAQTGNATHNVLGITGATTAIGTTGSLSNYNNFFYPNATGGFLSTNSAIVTLATWRTTFGTDANSISANPRLNSSTVLYPLLSSPMIGAAPTLSTPFNIDITGVTRNPLNSTIGAYEKAGDVNAPTFSDTIILGTTSTANRTLSALLNVIDDGGMVSNTGGTLPRLYYKKTTDANVIPGPTNNNSSFNGWKWVEATNTSAPYDFTFNVSLLRTPLAINDVIQYFFVAQDTVSVPNVSALPAAGFSGTSVATITTAPTTPKRFQVYNTPATFVGATGSQASVAKAIQNTDNVVILRVALQTGAGDSAYVSSLAFNSNGANDQANIRSAKVWYTGTNANFSTTGQFGTTYVNANAGPMGNITFNGAQVVPANSTVYFWLSYDILPGAIAGDSVDASVQSITYDWVAQTPVNATPAGSRTIKSSYCLPVPTGSRHISVVSFNTLNNNVGTTNFTTPFYVNYAPTGTATTTVRKGLTYNLSLTQSTASTSSIVYIDYNDNGVFELAEAINVSTNAGASATVSTVPVTIPCDAAASTEIRMRVVSYFTGSPWPTVCSASQNGEIQDYTISVLENPVDYTSSTATQFSGNIAPSALNKVVMRLPIAARGCGTAFLTEVRAHTARTQNASTNIANAKLYATGRSSIFNTAKLLATASAPSNNFIFSAFSDSLFSNAGDTNYYWITYDLGAGAILNDTIDIRIDSMNVANRFVVPSNNNPTQVMLVKAQNSYVNSLVTHPTVTRLVRRGQAFSPALRIRIVTSGTGAPVQLSEFNFDPAGGGIDTTNLTGARVFYTGNSTTFSTANQFGATYTGTSITNDKWNVFSISGLQDLNFDTNYFWLAYDLKSTATIGDSVDADLISFTVGSIQTPTSKSVAGGLPIRQDYCFMGPSGNNFSSSQGPSSFEEITNVQFGSLNNSSTCSQTGGVGSIVGQYSDYSDIVSAPAVFTGDTVRFSLTGVGNCNQSSNNTQNSSFVILVDWNQNGTFETATEVAFRSAASTSVRTYSGNVYIPCFALPGQTRMRIIYGSGSNAANALLLGTTCGNTSTTTYIYGETEDYTINVVSSPITYATTRVLQFTGLAGKDVTNVPVLRVAIKAKGCGSFTLDTLKFSTTGGTVLSNITNAKLYGTGNSNVFSTSNLLGNLSLSTPEFQFNGIASVISNTLPTDTSYFWLTYDIPPSAVAGNNLDAKLDSISVGGSWITVSPTIGNPTGNLVIADKMTYTSAVAIHPDLSSVGVGTTNRQVLRILVRGSSNSAPIRITSLSFNAGTGVNNGLNIDSARVFYTGKSLTFATTTRFGSSYSAAPGTWGNFNITGDLSTSLDSNVFWLVYDVKSSGVIFDSIDAQYTGVEFDGAFNSVSGNDGNPTGAITIRNAYCAASGAGNNIFGGFGITSSTIGGLVNTSTVATPYYSDFTTLTARTIQKNSSPISLTLTDAFSGVGGFTFVYVDVDQDGDFTSSNELVFSGATPTNGLSATVTPLTLNIPCDAKTGITRMRIVVNASNTVNSCTTAGGGTFGEVEDYLVNIVENPLTYQSSIASQTVGTVAQGGVGQNIMNIKIKTSGCGTPLLTNMYFNTTGSTNPASNILAAKLYKTGANRNFNTNTLVATVMNPNGPFNLTSLSIADTLISDTNNYWLTYDVSSFANSGDTLDVIIDSIVVIDSVRVPTSNNPTPVKTILAPLSIQSVSASNIASDRVGQGNTNFQAIQIMVIANSNGATLPVTRFDLNTVGGGNDVNNINNAKIYYTGNNKNFSTATQFGSTYTAGSNVSGGDWLPYTISGYQNILPDTNYFWLTYDVKPTATIGDSVDAQVTSVIIDGLTTSVSNPAPAGNSIVRLEYCFSAGSSGGRCIDTASVGTLFNATGASGCVSYTNYPKSGSLTTTAYAGSSLPIYLTFTSPTRASVFLDLNKNGVFESNEEFNLTPTIFVPFVSTSIVIPANAGLGDTRMRLRTFGGSTFGGTDRACSDWNNSETEDYTITILPALPQTTYTWNNSGTSDFSNPANWTPARNAALSTDNLVFDCDSMMLNLSNMFTQTVLSVALTQGTKVNLTSSGAANLKVIGNITLADAAILSTNSNVSVEIGENGGNPGTLNIGASGGIQSRVKRWVNAANSSNIVFPLIAEKGTRRIDVSYTQPPIASGSITARFVSTKAQGSTGFPLFESGITSDINQTTVDGYWQINDGDGLQGGVYTGVFYQDSVIFLNTPSAVSVINRTDDFSAWTLNGNHTNAVLQNAVTIVTRNTMQSFGQFALAADSIQNPLPVTLVSFTAVVEDEHALLKWITTSEQNNKGFGIERSRDGRNFETITFIDGYGNSNQRRSYSYHDNNAFNTSPVWYYRLAQTDFNGKVTYSRIVKVSVVNKTLEMATAFPNPFTDDVTLSINLKQAATINLFITDLQGRVLSQKQISSSVGSASIGLPEFHQMHAGVYFVRIVVDGETQVLKLIKQ